MDMYGSKNNPAQKNRSRKGKLSRKSKKQQNRKNQDNQGKVKNVKHEVKTTRVNVLSNQEIRSKRLTMLLLFTIVLLLVALVGLGYLYLEQKEKVADPTVIATEELQNIKSKVGRHFQLPDGEPTLATVMDADALREENPEFYKNASNGDKLLIYTSMAILYNPVNDIIVNVAPVIREPEVGDDVQQDQVDDGQVEVGNESKMTIELRNGTLEEIDWHQFEADIAGVMGARYELIGTTNAVLSEYQGTVVYDLTDRTRDNEIFQLADVLSATVEYSLPEGENVSDADVVIIVGG